MSDDTAFLGDIVLSPSFASLTKTEIKTLMALIAHSDNPGGWVDLPTAELPRIVRCRADKIRRVLLSLERDGFIRIDDHRGRVLNCFVPAVERWQQQEATTG